MTDEKRRELWELATNKNGWGAPTIASAMGLKGKNRGKSLEAIVKRGNKRSKLAPLLDEWLLEYAHTVFGGVPEKPKETRLTAVDKSILTLETTMALLEDDPEKQGYNASLILDFLDIIATNFAAELRKISGRK